MIYVKYDKSVQEFELEDTLFSREESEIYYLDFTKMSFIEGLGDTLEFKIKFNNDSYYLNIESYPGLYSTSQLKFFDNDIKIKMLDFGIRDSINPTDEFIKKYQLIPKKEDRDNFGIMNYLANLNNAEFAKLTESEEVFQPITWYKIESRQNHFYWIVLVGIGLAAIILTIKTKKITRRIAHILTLYG